MKSRIENPDYPSCRPNSFVVKDNFGLTTQENDILMEQIQFAEKCLSDYGIINVCYGTISVESLKDATFAAAYYESRDEITLNADKLLSRDLKHPRFQVIKSLLHEIGHRIFLHIPRAWQMWYWSQLDNATEFVSQYARTNFNEDFSESFCYLVMGKQVDQQVKDRVDKIVNIFLSNERNAGLKQNPEYWGTAGAGILPVALDTGRFLLALRSDHVMEPGTIGVIGGKLDTVDKYNDDDYWDEDESEEDLEDPADAALREFQEETGRSANLVLDLIPLYVFHDDDVGFTYHNFLGVVDSEFNARTNWETDEWMWLTLDELKKIRPKHFGLKALLDDRESMNVLKRYGR